MNVILTFTLLMFIIGSFGMFLAKTHIIIILISLEILLLSIMLNFVSISMITDDILGQIYGLLILTVAAAESSLGLAILVSYYRLRGGISLDLVNLLKS